ncbi:hypothetical protein [Acholeplasma laidlawii]|uniref:Nuclear transport factor 2 family protein n=3 Tax=Acholeplasma laidlawii TaxID=2148 RepID=A9NGA7_ACHLI|nr:hypothetical protein [Acholeplasma laidlawii]ABX81387.1 hypothetical protein ACL_0771 [Acholeplasma laidlawii PG-8A]NWH10034.1 hypothetical protein [Acholeplasma laidlawii]NWH11425.1 hypothetical protein [Acholeplasma laidlawii]NWH13165.1 hypothetical protein [Acholeplasma laidlawii]NWH14979.1 hypothetical protein [Acholeplasma laidlawii]
MKLEVMYHCGNAPKMERVIDLTIALSKKDIDTVKTHVREDFTWKIVGENHVVKLEQLSQTLTTKPQILELIVKNALSHGKGAMCEGIMTFNNGLTYEFCNIVQFVNTAKDALIKEAHTYFIKT